MAANQQSARGSSYGAGIDCGLDLILRDVVGSGRPDLWSDHALPGHGGAYPDISTVIVGFGNYLVTR
jgi:hypothetical protein